MLRDISTRLNSTAVVCNASLLSVLARSSLVGDVAELLKDKAVQEKTIHTLESLPTEQLGILRSAVALAKAGSADERIEVSQVDVVTNLTHAQLLAVGASSARLEISSEVFEAAHAHAVSVGACPAAVGGAVCRCREVAVAAALLACSGAESRAERRSWAAAAAHAHATTDAGTAMHGTVAPVLPAQAAEFSEREHALRSQLQDMRSAAEQTDAANGAELTKLRDDMKRLEKTIMAEEVKRANEAARARDVVAPELDALRRQVEQERVSTQRLTEQVVGVEAGARNSARLLEESKTQLERERCGHLRYVAATEAQSQRQQTMITKRSEEIASLLASNGTGTGSGEAVQALLLVISELREDAEKEDKRQLCCICFEQPPNAIFMPCKHGGSCVDCAKKIGKPRAMPAVPHADR